MPGKRRQLHGGHAAVGHRAAAPATPSTRPMNKALGVEPHREAGGREQLQHDRPDHDRGAKKLPDWIQLPNWWNSNFNIGELAGTQLADLTPYLAGDKIKKYPNLAAIPTGAWQAGAWGDKLYGIPSLLHRLRHRRRDLLPARHPGRQGHHRRPGAVRRRPDEPRQGADRRQARRVGLRRRVDLPLHAWDVPRSGRSTTASWSQVRAAGVPGRPRLALPPGDLRLPAPGRDRGRQREREHPLLRREDADRGRRHRRAGT